MLVDKNRKMNKIICMKEGILSHVVRGEDVASAWLSATEFLLGKKGEAFNLVVQIENPLEVNPTIRGLCEAMCKTHGLLNIKQVAYTIFPQSLYEGLARKNATRLFKSYNRPNGVFDRIKTRWGTYFRRMTHTSWPKTSEPINQLANLIEMLQSRAKVRKATYIIVISCPPLDAKRIMGGPCLNYIALQLTRNSYNEKMANMLAVYRNHNFVQRAFGNYVGLGWLLGFICEQSGYKVGWLTCISSHATIQREAQSCVSWPSKPQLKALVETIKNAMA